MLVRPCLRWRCEQLRVCLDMPDLLDGPGRPTRVITHPPSRGPSHLLVTFSQTRLILFPFQNPASNPAVPAGAPSCAAHDGSGSADALGALCLVCRNRGLSRIKPRALSPVQQGGWEKQPGLGSTIARVLYYLGYGSLGTVAPRSRGFRKRRRREKKAALPPFLFPHPIHPIHPVHFRNGNLFVEVEERCAAALVAHCLSPPLGRHQLETRCSCSRPRDPVTLLVARTLQACKACNAQGKAGLDGAALVPAGIAHLASCMSTCPAWSEDLALLLRRSQQSQGGRRRKEKEVEGGFRARVLVAP